MLFYFYLFIDKQKLKSQSCSQSNSEKLKESDIFEIVIRNKTFVEPYGDFVDQALPNLRSSLRIHDSEAHNIPANDE